MTPHRAPGLLHAPLREVRLAMTRCLGYSFDETWPQET
jgi:hypothetical protein